MATFVKQKTNRLLPTFVLSVVLGWITVQEQCVSVSADLALSGVLSMGFNAAMDESGGCTPEQLHRVNREIFMVVAQQAGVPYDIATDVNSWAWMSDVEVELELIEEECKFEHDPDGHGDDGGGDWDHLRNGFLGEDVICPSVVDDGKEFTRDGRGGQRRRGLVDKEEEEEESLRSESQNERDLVGCYNCVSIGVNWYDCIGCYGRRRRELRTRTLTQVELASLKTVGTAICMAISGDSGTHCLDCSSFQVMLV